MVRTHRAGTAAGSTIRAASSPSSAVFPTPEGPCTQRMSRPSPGVNRGEMMSVARVSNAPRVQGRTASVPRCPASRGSRRLSTLYSGPDVSQVSALEKSPAHSGAIHNWSSSSAPSRRLCTLPALEPSGLYWRGARRTQKPNRSDRRAASSSRMRTAAAAAAPASRSDSGPSSASHTPCPIGRAGEAREPRAAASAASSVARLSARRRTSCL